MRVHASELHQVTLYRRNAVPDQRLIDARRALIGGVQTIEPPVIYDQMHLYHTQRHLLHVSLLCVCLCLCLCVCVLCVRVCVHACVCVSTT